MNDSETLKSIDKKLSSLISLLILSLPENSKIKPEVILSSNGMDNKEIASILGKNLSAVQKSLQRSKK